MNKKASTFLVILIVIFYFIVGMILYQFIKPEIDSTRTNIVCASPSTAGDRVTCLIVDGIIPIVIITILASAGGYLTERLLR